jgi:hypothetical protein
VEPAIDGPEEAAADLHEWRPSQHHALGDEAGRLLVDRSPRGELGALLEVLAETLNVEPYSRALQ